jgi:hypothetical protein
MNRRLDYMRDTGQMIRGMVKDTRDTKMITHTLVSFKTTNLRVKVSIHGRMVKCMMDSGTRARRRVMVCGEVSMETAISVNGKEARQRGMECICGKMETSTRESGVTVSNMGTAQTSLATVTPSRGSTSTANRMASGNISGVMAHFTLVTSARDSNTVKESGASPIDLSLTHMRVSIIWIRNMAMEYFHGSLAICTKETTRMMRETAMERCTGPMAQSTRESGGKDASMDSERCYSLMVPYLKVTSI